MSNYADPDPADSPPLPWRYFIAGSLSALLIFALGGASFWLFQTARAGQAVRAAPPQSSIDTGLLAEAWHIVEADFLGGLPSPTERTYGAIKGSIDTLHDPYTYFVEPEPAVREQEQLEGHFGGIGATLTLQEDGHIRLDPLIDRPADQAGIQAGDILLAVDGQVLPTPADLDQATNLLRGPVATVVRVTVLRGGKELDFDVTRSQFELAQRELAPARRNA